MPEFNNYLSETIHFAHPGNFVDTNILIIRKL